MIIDAHTHLMRQFGFIKGAPLEEQVAALRQGGADKSVIFTLEGLLGNYRHYNDAVAEAAIRYPDVLIPFCTLDPRDGGALAELERCVNQLGMKGIKFHPWLQAFPIVDTMVMPIVEKAVQYGLPIISHDGTPPYCTSLEVAYLAASFPAAKIILGHAGLKDYAREALAAAKRYPNLYLCFCGTTLQAMRNAVRVVGPERCMFGSDLPFGGADYLALEIYKVKQLGLSLTEESDVLGGTIARLLGLG